MLLFFYQFLWTILVVVFLPSALLAKGGRIRERLAPPLPSGRPAGKTVWIHALSVGEVISALPLVKALKRVHPSQEIVFTVTTRQGMHIAREQLLGQVQALLVMPFDFWWSLRRIVRYIRPGLFILVETDLWPGLLHLLRQKGIKSILINGRISPRTLRSYARYRFFVKRMFGDVDQCLMQSDLDTDRLRRVGVEAAKVRTVGNIKFDRHWAPMSTEEYDGWRHRLKLKPEDWVWVAGSTHRGEEEVLLDVFLKLRAFFPRLRLIIAPRKLEEATDIYDLTLKKGLKPVLKTALIQEKVPYDILILNTLGELGRIYGIARISFVGGSLIPAGGHNLLEPAYFGRPVLFGPHTENFVLMSELLIEADGGKRVKDGEDLFRRMKDLLVDPQGADRMGQRARAFVEMNRGALKRVLDHLHPYL
ncbi:MAG: 3-deoxy-D-manno-octulosonic acid transferase [Proteobacteria bacterium]|nr:3-deoxy-D-manno-octulosonic acid transferase [Pseudomonadota bacterium]